MGRERREVDACPIPSVRISCFDDKIGWARSNVSGSHETSGFPKPPWWCSGVADSHACSAAEPGLTHRRPDSALAQSDPEAKAWIAGFLQGLEKRGWSENRNLHIDDRFAPAAA